MSEEIRAFDWKEERAKHKVMCSACLENIQEGYVYVDRFSFTYCRGCYMSFRDFASMLHGKNKDEPREPEGGGAIR